MKLLILPNLLSFHFLYENNLGTGPKTCLVSVLISFIVNSIVNNTFKEYDKYIHANP